MNILILLHTSFYYDGFQLTKSIVPNHNILDVFA